jgi:SRSO17 transposase
LDARFRADGEGSRSEGAQRALTKPEIAVEEIDRLISAGVRFGIVLADSGYGSSASFCQALSERGLRWAVGLSRRQNVYSADVVLIFPVAKTGRRRKDHMPGTPPIAAEAMLADENWRKVTWRRGTKGPLSCRFAARRVRLPMATSTGLRIIAFNACQARRFG